MAKGHKAQVQEPAFLCARLVFEFFNNEDIEFKNNSLRRIGKELRKELNVSVCPIRDTLLDDPERAVMALALAAGSKAEAKELADKALSYLDAHMPGRLVSEDWVGEELETQ